MKKILKWAVVSIGVIPLLVGACSVALAKGSPGGGHGGHEGWEGGSTPPGWSHGKKTGWHGADQPPGFEKRETGEDEKAEKHDTDKD